MAYSAVTFSLVAILSVCVTLPMVYNYVSHVQENTRREMLACKASAKEIMDEVRPHTQH